MQTGGFAAKARTFLPYSELKEIEKNTVRIKNFS
jgi:hypothetical protein